MAAKQPNILILWGDDIGIWNISYHSRGMMGYRTPNIDRVANEGVAFTDYYGQQSCTAGRAAFIYWPEPAPHRPDQSRHARRRRSDFRRKIRPSPNCSSRSATPPASSARTISAIGMNTCRPCTASMSSSATSIT